MPDHQLQNSNASMQNLSGRYRFLLTCSMETRQWKDIENIVSTKIQVQKRQWRKRLKYSDINEWCCINVSWKVRRTEWNKKAIEMQHTPEEGQKSDWLKCCNWNNKGKDSSLNNSLSNNNFKIWDKFSGTQGKSITRCSHLHRCKSIGF